MFDRVLTRRSGNDNIFSYSRRAAILGGTHMRVASFFAGVGGIDTGFQNAGFDVIWANEFDKYAATTYKMNFDNKLVVDDIRNVHVKDIPDFDIMIGGFPCQAFSVAGLRKGFDDERGDLFFQLERIFKTKKPDRKSTRLNSSHL